VTMLNGSIAARKFQCFKMSRNSNLAAHLFRKKYQRNAGKKTDAADNGPLGLTRHKTAGQDVDTL